MKDDLISRQAAIDYCYALINAENPSDPTDEWNYSQERINQTEVILHHLEFMPSAQPEVLAHGEGVLNTQHDNDRIWEALSKVYNMNGVPDEAKSIVGDVMLELDEPTAPTEQRSFSHGQENDASSAQPDPCDDPRADIYYLAEKIGIHRLYALVVELRGEPTPCEDAVSRQAAIDAVKDWIRSEEFRWSNATYYMEKRIKALPSAQPERKKDWIPCSKKPNPDLPEEDVRGYFLVTLHTFGDIGFDLDELEVCKMQWDRKNGWWLHHHSPEWINEALTQKVLAWMPLPEPYTEDPCNGCGYLGESCVGEGCGKLTERKEGEAE